MAFLNLYQHAKNQFIPLPASWDTTGNFRVLWQEWPHLFLTPPNNIFQSTFNCYEFVLTYKKSSLFKNCTIWLAKSVLTHIPWARFFPNIVFVQEIVNNINFHYRANSGKTNDQIFEQIQNNLFLVQFWPKKFFQKIWPCHTQLHMGF